MTTAHGGARPGAGRKTLSKTEDTERHCLTLPASMWRKLEAIGGGNRSAGARLVIDFDNHIERIND